MKNLILALTLFGCVSFCFAQSRGLVTSSNANNQALLIAASNGLMGLDYDIKMVERIATHTDYSFKPHKLLEDEATTANAKAALSSLARDAGSSGTLFFYYTGHGDKGSLFMGDQTDMRVADIRSGIETGRESLGPIERLVVMYDSCHSGSLVDPLRAFLPRPETASLDAAEALFNGLQPTRGRGAYWKSLFVFASSTAEETSTASATGSHFTKGLSRAFEEAAQKKGTMETLVSLTKSYTQGHHPVERFAPPSLAQELLIKN